MWYTYLEILFLVIYIFPGKEDKMYNHKLQDNFSWLTIISHIKIQILT